MNKHHLDRYHKFIDSLKNQVVSGYCEKHHILPRSLGGSDDASNLILLTARQHYVAHWILWKAYAGPMAVAFDYMNGIKKYGKRLTSKAIEALKADVSKRISERPVSDETREKQRQAKLGRKLSEETKRKVADAGRGRKTSDETRRKISEAKRGIATRGAGWKHSEETRKKMTEAQYARNLKWEVA